MNNFGFILLHLAKLSRATAPGSRRWAKMSNALLPSQNHQHMSARDSLVYESAPGRISAANPCADIS